MEKWKWGKIKLDGFQNDFRKDILRSLLMQVFRIDVNVLQIYRILLSVFLRLKDRNISTL